MALVEVAHDPFASNTKGTLVPVTHDPFSKPKFEAQEDTVYSPEGIPLITPTTQAEPTGTAGTVAKTLGSVAGAPVRAAMSLVKPAANVMSWMGAEEPAKAIKQMDVGIKEQGPELMGLKDPIGSVASLGGDIAGFSGLLKAPGAIANLPYIGSHVAPMVNKSTAILEKLPGWAQSTLGGAAVGTLGAETPLKAIQEGGLGAVAGAATHGVLTGAGHALSPVLQRIKDLQAKGFSLDEIKKDTTIGQMFGGGIQAMENFFAALPLSGAMQKIETGAKSLKDTAKTKAELMAQADTNAIAGMEDAKTRALKELKNSLTKKHGEWEKRHGEFFANRTAKLTAEEEQFSIDQINKSLAHIGEKLPEGVKGTAAIEYAQEKIGNAYKKPLSEIGDVRVSPEFENKLKDLAELHKNEMIGTGNAEKLDAEVGKLIKAAGDSRLLSSEQWHTLLKSLGQKANNYTRSGDPERRELGMALKDLRSEWSDLVEHEGIKLANKAHGTFQPAQKAASYLKSVTEQGGVFDPKQYINAIKSETSTRRFAGGAHPEQADAVAAYENMMARREAEKAFETKKAAELKAKKSGEMSAVEAAAIQQATNIAKQTKYLKAQTAESKKKLAAGAEEATGDIGKIVSYPEKRMLYQASGLGGGAGLGTVGAMAGISPTTTAMALSIPWLASNALYRFGGQNAIKNLALKPRSENVRQIGEALKEYAPAGALAGAQQYKEARNRPGVQVIDPNTGEELNPPKGGLP